MKKEKSKAITSKSSFAIFLLLSCIILLASAARSYHLDYPAIGYHNVKENFYIGMAKFMIMDGDCLHRKAFDSGYLEIPYFEEYPQIPLLSWWAVLVWPFTSGALWPIRSLVVLSSCLCIYLIFRITSLLKGNHFLGLCSAIFLALFPLSIFFGRNIQPEALALACMLVGTLFFLKWRDSLDTRLFAALALFFGIGALLKLTFLIVAFPLVFLLPYTTIFQRAKMGLLFKTVTAGFFGLFPFIAWNVAAPFINKVTTLTEQTQHRVRIFDIFTQPYWTKAWPPIHSYIDENFTWGGALLILAGFSTFGFLVPSKLARLSSILTILCAVGIIVCFPSPNFLGPSRMVLTGSPLGFAAFTALGFILILITTLCATRQGHLLGAYIGGSILALIPYAAILSDFIGQHNYYQYPFLPLASLSAALPLFFLKNALTKPLGASWANAPSMALILFLLPGVYKNTARMFDTQFFGSDMAGGFLKKVMPEGERFFLFGSHQSVGFGNYSERLCIFSGTFPSLKISLQDFLKYEQKFGIDWVCVDVLNSGLPIMNLDPQVFKYLQDNFGVAAVGVLKIGDQLRLATLILHKSGSFDLNRIGELPILKNNPIAKGGYELTSGHLQYEIFSDLKTK